MKGLVAAQQQAQRAAQARPLAAHFEECQAFIKRSQNMLSVWRKNASPNKKLWTQVWDGWQGSAKMTRATESAIPDTIPNGRGPCCGDQPIASQSCRDVWGPDRRSALMQTLIDQEVLLSRSRIVSAHCEDSPQQDREVLQVSWC